MSKSCLEKRKKTDSKAVLALCTRLKISCRTGRSVGYQHCGHLHWSLVIGRLSWGTASTFAFSLDQFHKYSTLNHLEATIPRSSQSPPNCLSFVTPSLGPVVKRRRK